MEPEPYFMSLDDINQSFSGGFDDFFDDDLYNAPLSPLDNPFIVPNETPEAQLQAQRLDITLPDLALLDFELPKLDAGSPYPAILDLRDDVQDATNNGTADAGTDRDFDAWLDLQVLNSIQPTEFDTLIASIDEHLRPAVTLETNACDIDALGSPCPALSIEPQAFSIPANSDNQKTERDELLTENQNDAREGDGARQAAQHVRSPLPTSPVRRESPSQKGSPCHPDRRSAELAGVQITTETTYDTPHTPLLENTSKRRRKWTTGEDDLLIQLVEENIEWHHIVKEFPGRSLLDCQLRCQNLLEKQTRWDEGMVNKFAKLYARYKDQMWQIIASELKIPWRSAESMHWMLGEVELTARANAPAAHDERTAGLETGKRRRNSPGSACRDHEIKFGRTIISPAIQELLEDQFNIKPYAGQHTLDKLSASTGLSVKQIRTWYANARSRKTSTFGEFDESLRTRLGNDSPARRSSSLARSDTSMRSLGSAMSCASVRSIDPRGPRRGRKGWTATSYDPPVLLPPTADPPHSPQTKTSTEASNIDEAQSRWHKEPVRKFPDIERALANWARNHQRQGLPLSDAIIKDKARFFAQTVGNSDSYLKANSTSWLEMFKQKNHLMGARSRKGSMVGESERTLSNVETPGVTPSNDQDGTMHDNVESRVQNGRRAVHACKQAASIFCTWPSCKERFTTRSAWARHEEATHYCPYHWVCCPDISSSQQETLPTCFICEQQDISYDHITAHDEFKKCRDKDEESRTFFRQDHLQQHIKGTHKRMNKEWKPSYRTTINHLVRVWQRDNPSLSAMALHCGFCDAVFETWTERQDHVFAHFQEDSSGRRADKSDWNEPPLAAL
ncbi:hypothetical protein FB567DRAFT_630541 [Paraphoma chrysanthemicola]|uniref:Uncharacterized protein n=1 Tax=Paraphoma chrysanthemicola TaxID=798071 RepID=A0A8K0VWK5_9PLEO|nr:hypothetical protein FB567DRAFT_630541 [Paraphoma chrysanthemicola]